MQADHTTKKCAAIGRIACGTRTILPNNNSTFKTIMIYRLLYSVVTVSRWPRSAGFDSVLGKKRGFGFLTSNKPVVEV